MDHCQGGETWCQWCPVSEQRFLWVGLQLLCPLGSEESLWEMIVLQALFLFYFLDGASRFEERNTSGLLTTCRKALIGKVNVVGVGVNKFRYGPKFWRTICSWYRSRYTQMPIRAVAMNLSSEAYSPWLKSFTTRIHQISWAKIINVQTDNVLLRRLGWRCIRYGHLLHYSEASEYRPMLDGTRL